MTRASILAAGRAAAEAGMVDSCTIRRVTGRSTDPVTGVVSDVLTEVYSGKCRVQTQGNWGERRDVAQDSMVLLTVQVQLPISVTDARAEDRITIDSSVNDAALVGKVFLMRDEHYKSEATARRVMVTRVTG